MTDGEWADIDDMLSGWWHQDWDEHRSAMYRLALNSYDPKTVGAVVHSFLVEGDAFRPSAAQVVARIIGKPLIANPDEAWVLIERAIKRVGVSQYDPRFDEAHQAAIDWLAERDPIVAAFAARR